MASDWVLIRRLMNAVLDACEQVDELEIREDERDVMLTRDGEPVASVWDALVSAHTYPESVRYELIRARGQLGEAGAYVQPLSRVLQEVGSLCAELVNAERVRTPVQGANPRRPDDERSIADSVEQLARWYEEHLVPLVRQGLAEQRSGTS